MSDKQNQSSAGMEFNSGRDDRVPASSINGFEGQHDISGDSAQLAKEENEQMLKTLKDELVREKTAGTDGPSQISNFQAPGEDNQGTKNETVQAPSMYDPGVEMSKDEESQLRSLQDDLIRRLEQQAPEPSAVNAIASTHQNFRARRQNNRPTVPPGSFGTKSRSNGFQQPAHNFQQPPAQMGPVYVYSGTQNPATPYYSGVPKPSFQGSYQFPASSYSCAQQPRGNNLKRPYSANSSNQGRNGRGQQVARGDHWEGPAGKKAKGAGRGTG